MPILLLWSKVKPHFGYVIAVVVIVAGLLYLGPCKPTPDDSNYQTELSSWKDSVALVNKQNVVINSAIDSVSKEKIKSDSQVVILHKQIVGLQHFADSAKTVNDKKLNLAITTLPDTCQLAIDVAIGFKTEADSLQTEVRVWQKQDSIHTKDILGLQFTDSLLTVDRDRYKNLVGKVPVYNSPKILWIIPQPSRKQSFIAGIILGIGYHFIPKLK